MQQLKVCFIGIGSIAKRHIRNLRWICNKREIDIIIDAVRREKKQYDGVDTIYSKADDVPRDYDIIFITNPTIFHLTTLKEFQDKGRHFFIEKPLLADSQMDEIDSLSLKEGAVYYVASPLRYHAIIQWIKKKIDPSDVISVRCISSSYLPDWRPEQDYRNTYSARKEMGGGVSTDLIHEWDYLTYLFGWPNEIKCLKGRKSALEIDCDDYALYIAEYDNKIAELHLDYFGRKTLRQIQLFTNKDTIVADLVANRVHFLKSNEYVIFQEKRDDYQTKELEYFLGLIQNNVRYNGIFHSIKVLKLTQGKVS